MMQTRFLSSFISIFLLIQFIVIVAAHAATNTLELDTFLAEVKSSNLEVKAALQASEAAKLKANEKDLITGFNLFSDLQYQSDGKLPVMPFFTYDKMNTQNYNLGVSKLTTFGTGFKLYYNLMHYEYVNMVMTGGANIAPFYDARPVFEVSQSLWGNGFGRSTQASIQAVESQSLSMSYAHRFKARLGLVQAEQAYWRLVFARERVGIAQTAYEQAKKIFQWSQNRARSNLGDEADALQARAALDLRELEVQSALDEERASRRAFNSARNREGDDVPEVLGDVNVNALLGQSFPEKPETRDDVKAAEEQQKAAVAVATTAAEKNRPTLDVFGSYALNGRSGQMGEAFSGSYNQGRPTYALGVKFVMPLDQSASSDAIEGATLDKKAAELTYQQKLQDQNWNWRDLRRKLDEGARRLKLSQQIVTAQKAKLDHERTRLRQGRTTTFQVLLFETEYAQSQLALLQAEADIVSVNAQMKLYGSK